jgi:molybdate transport system permease protein
MIRHSMGDPKSRARGRPGRSRTTVILWLLAVPLIGLFAAPIVALVVRASPLSLVEHFAEPAVLQAIQLSLMTSTVSTVLAVVFGTPLGYILARRRFPGRGALETLVELPMVLPPSVAGIALLVAFGRRGVLGTSLSQLGFEPAFTSAAVVMAQLFVAAPYYVKAAAGAFARVDRDLEQAAQVLGASSLRIFRRITVPLAWPALLGGAVMAWARALGEFGATIIFAGNYPGRTQTMPLAIYLGFELDFAVALTLAMILLLISGIVLGIVKLLLSREARSGRPT